MIEDKWNCISRNDFSGEELQFLAHMGTLSKWIFHSELVARDFPFSNKNKMWNENVNPIPIKENIFQMRRKSHIFSLRMVLPFRFILIFSESCLKL